ncbi:glycosyltransferase family 4 protein [Brachybacterium muris]|uniref:glycosyltransferase family 4 protein n=1 Tax=Brachybacterium muris TaxID=219301 RepID=UPI0021A2EC7C|nr:glycosyltransferase family 4 protein [Brachybacterium muris]MCT1997289.1 glycosyltransferase family 4 protein [Brachybacterium muris]
MVLSGGLVEEALALWCVPVADLGGVARHVLDAARAGIPGWRLVVLCPVGPLAAALRAQGTPVVTGTVSPADGTAVAVRTIRRTLQRLRPDLLHTHLAFADLAGVAAVTGLRAGRGERIRLVSTEHGISGVRGYYQAGDLQARVKAGAHRVRLLRTDRVIAVSDSTAAQVAAQWGSGQKLTVIRNGVDAPQPTPQPRAGLRVLSLARLAPEKNIDQLMQAFARVAREHPEARLTIAGRGLEEGALRTLAYSLHLEDRIDFPGHVDAGEALCAHDVVVQLSAWENLSYTLLDAAAHRLGVVATNVGGNGEILPGRCLVTADEARSPEVVAARIVAQGSDLAARPGPAEHGLTVAEMTAAIADVYREVAA